MLASAAPAEEDAAAAEPVGEPEDEKYHEKFNEDLAAQEKLMKSVDVLIKRMGDVPVIVVPCVIGRADGQVTTSWVPLNSARSTRPCGTYSWL